ncbi:MAG: helix-turn-helix transcriptional regulator [Proteobacteria bacterium]|nr:helix-turn-helix transcriptional regulator [Pseudomonadota bacterium]
MTPIRLRLRELRERRGLSQTALGDLAGVKQARISELENGHGKRLNLDMLEQLADALGCEPGELIERVPAKKGRR